MSIEPGQTVVVVLQNPREKVFGILGEIGTSGVTLRCIDLDYFDEWIKAIKGGEPMLPMQDTFYPMWRIERINRDAESKDIPSLSAQFNQRTGLRIEEF